MDGGPHGGGGRCGDGPAAWAFPRPASSALTRSRRPRSPAPCRRLAGRRSCPRTIPITQLRRDWPLFDKMIAEGYTGRKGKGGFYPHGARGRGQASGGDRPQDRAIPAEAGEAAARQRRRGQGGLRALVEHPDKGGQLCLARAVAHALPMPRCVAPEIADDIASVDRRHAAGFRLEIRPLRADRPHGRQISRRSPGRGEAAGAAAARRGGRRPAASIASARGSSSSSDLDGNGYAADRAAGGRAAAGRHQARRQAAAANGSASLWDIGDGVACLEFHSKMNSIDPDTLRPAAAIAGSDRQAQDEGAGDPQRGREFLRRASIWASPCSRPIIAMWPMIEDMVATRARQTYKAIKYAAFPVVGAPSGMALGGGCEILLHSLGHRRPCRDLYRAGGGRRRAGARLGRLQGDAGAQPRAHPGPRSHAAGGARPSKPSPPPRSAAPRPRRRELGYLPPERRDRHEPRPAARRRQGEGACAWRRTTAAGANRIPSCRGRRARRR